MSIHKLKATYHGVQLELEIQEDLCRARLFINGIVRAEENGEQRLRLGTTVQTDYEWHELIEGIVQFEDNKISATIFANNFKVSHQTFSCGETWNWQKTR